jgi:hypothetical protein
MSADEPIGLHDLSDILEEFKWQLIRVKSEIFVL